MMSHVVHQNRPVSKLVWNWSMILQGNSSNSYASNEMWLKTIVIQCQSQQLNQDFLKPIVSLVKFLLKFVQNKLTQKYSSLIKFCNAQIRDSIKFIKLNFYRSVCLAQFNFKIIVPILTWGFRNGPIFDWEISLINRFGRSNWTIF